MATIPQLAGVLEHGLQLRLQMSADVHLVIRVIASGKEQLVDLVRLQTLLRVLRIVEVIAYRRIDRIAHSDADGAVVRVVEARPETIPREHHVGPVAPEEAYHLPAQLGVRLHEPVRQAEKDHFLHAQHLAGLPLLLLADRGQLLRRERRIVRTLVAAGCQDVVDRPSLRAPFRHGAAAKELSVVGVGDDDHRRQRTVLAQFVGGLLLLAAGQPTADTLQRAHA